MIDAVEDGVFYNLPTKLKVAVQKLDSELCEQYEYEKILLQYLREVLQRMEEEGTERTRIDCAIGTDFESEAITEAFINHLVGLAVYDGDLTHVEDPWRGRTSRLRDLHCALPKLFQDQFISAFMHAMHRGNLIPVVEFFRREPFELEVSPKQIRNCKFNEIHERLSTLAPAE